MYYFVRIRYRTKEDGGEIEGICELDFESFDTIDIFADATKFSENIQELEIIRVESKTVLRKGSSHEVLAI